MSSTRPALGERVRHGLDHRRIAALRDVRHGFEQGHGSTLRCRDAALRPASTPLPLDQGPPTRPRHVPALPRRPATRSSPRRSSTAHPGKQAYLYGQAPGIVEGAEGAPWRGRAGRTLRRWLELDEETFYATFYCASVTRCYPGRTAGGRGDRTPTPAERRLCAPWREEELRLLRPDLILTVGGLAAHAIIGVRDADGMRRQELPRRRRDRDPAAAPLGRERVAQRHDQPRPPRQGAHARPPRARSTRRPKRVCEDDRMSDEQHPDNSRTSTPRSSTASKARSRPRRSARRA